MIFRLPTLTEDISVLCETFDNISPTLKPQIKVAKEDVSIQQDSKTKLRSLKKQGVNLYKVVVKHESLDIDAMSNAVKVIALCGIDVVADEKRFQAAIRDFLQ